MPWLTRVAPNHEGQGLQPGASLGTAHVPKKDVTINPINLHGELTMLIQCHLKIEHILLNSHLFNSMFSGILQI